MQGKKVGKSDKKIHRDLKPVGRIENYFQFKTNIIADIGPYISMSDNTVSFPKKYTNDMVINISKLLAINKKDE